MGYSKLHITQRVQHNTLDFLLNNAKHEEHHSNDKPVGQQEIEIEYTQHF